MLKLAPEPKYKKLYSQLKKEHEALKLENDILRDKVLTISQMVLSGKTGDVEVENGIGRTKTIPKHVAEWMIEHNVPWQVLWCDEHNRWIDDLDSLFPYHMECSTCPKCRGDD